MIVFFIGIVIGIASLIFFFISNGKNSENSQMGINLKRVYCPKCGLKQPIIRKPKNERQALYGGNTCKNCGTEMDKYGQKIVE